MACEMCYTYVFFLLQKSTVHRPDTTHMYTMYVCYILFGSKVFHLSILMLWATILLQSAKLYHLGILQYIGSDDNRAISEMKYPCHVNDVHMIIFFKLNYKQD